MKDIYSPLEIDEEWDQRAPDMDGNEGGGTTVAVAPAQEAVTGVDTSTESNMGASTLSPDLAAEAPAATDAAPMAGDTIEPMGDMMADPAHDAASVTLEQPQVMPVTETTTPNPGTLDISEMSSGEDHEPTHAVVEADDSEAGATQDATPVLEGNNSKPTKVSVMGDTEADEADNNTVEAGATFNPETFPGGKMPEPKSVEPEAEAVEADDEPEEEPELPTSPNVVEDAEEPKHEDEEGEDQDAPELKSFKDRLEQQRQSNVEAALRIKERAEELKKHEQEKADEAMANVQHADSEIAEIEDELSRLGYKEAA